ncbi:MAG: hypothetical protein ACI9JN_000561 [Bacteroidia bacterium]|jgi:hypothetical protein
MKSTTTAILMVVCYASLFGQSIPKATSTNWNNLATHSEIKQSNVINIKRLGADITGKNPADKYVQLAIENSRQTGAIIYFPKGTYLLNEPIKLTSNQYLAGDGSTQTILKFDLGGNGHLISSVGTTFAQWTDIIYDASKEDETIVSKNEYLNAGDLIRIRITNKAKTTSEWADGSIGQITRVKSFKNGTIQLADPLRLDLTSDEMPKLIKVNPHHDLGVVNLKIVRLDATSGQTSNIHFEYTDNAIVSGVHSDSCNYAHVNNVFSYKNRIEGSYFTNAFNHGGGGKAYGVVLAFSSSQCMVENNIFEHLRHSILFQAGSNGNIVGYNYSRDAYWTGVFSPADFSGDIVMHGNYPFLNLIEGNIIQNLVIDNSHGINGPGNVFLRNRIENAGIFMNCSPATDFQAFIGNEITGTGTSSNGIIPFPKGLYSLCGRGHYAYANNQNGKMIPTQVDALVNSLYYKSEPAFLSNTTFPAIGYPNTTQTSTIPALTRAKKEKKTVDYSFNVDLGPKFYKMDVRKIDLGILITWSTNLINECETYSVHRKEDNKGVVQIVSIKSDQKTNLSEYSFKDYHYNTKSTFVTYYVVYHDFFGEAVASNEVQIQLNGGNVGIQSDGLGHVFFQPHITHMRLLNLSGQEMYSQAVNRSVLNLPTHILNGIYVIEYTGNRVVNRTKVQITR